MRNKKTLMDMWVFGITAIIFYIGFMTLACYTLEEGPLLGIVICSSTVFFVLVCFYLLKLEVDAGYYECGKCHHRYKAKYFNALIAPHIHTTRWLRCPKCKKISWSKKVMTKE